MGFTTSTFDLENRSDQEIVRFLEKHAIGLTLQEAKQLQFSILRRAPSLAEFILFGIEGSEHCSYKSSRVHLKQFVTEGENVVLGAKEDAGVVRVVRDRAGRGYCVVISHESHNHPSQIVPYEGAATGVGGNVRDICCMGAEVVALADDLRFGEIRSARSKWIYQGVVSGVAGYGNPLGVPSLAGGLQFDRGYQDNCLVTVVSLGILREDRIFHSHAPDNADGYNLILVGKPTDSSGFGGAAFASFELLEEEREQNKGAVQEPNAFLGRHLLQASTALFEKLSEMGVSDRIGCKDLGAGGIACAGVEIAESAGYGAAINLDLVHTDDASHNGASHADSDNTGASHADSDKNGGGNADSDNNDASHDAPSLPSHVVLCSETQERYLWAVPPELTDLVLDHFNSEFSLPRVSRGAQARVIGKITAAPQFTVTARGEVIVDAPASEVTKGFLYHRPWTEPPADPGETVDAGESARAVAAVVVAGAAGAAPAAAEILLRLLAHENIASRAPLYERYDKQVQGRVTIEAGLADSGILAPFNDDSWPEEIRHTGITLTTDQNPRINRRDPWRGAALAVVESFTNTIAVGAEPLAISDCLCYGNPEKPDQMGQFVAGCRGVAEAARELNLPVVAGNVSFYNESATASIPPSPMIACVGRLTDYRVALPGQFVAPGSPVYLLGDRTGRWGGSVFEEIMRETGLADLPAAPLPLVEFEALRNAGAAVRAAAGRGLIRSCHDIAEGGLAVALCEMSFSAGPGCALTGPAGAFSSIPPIVALFEETPGFVLEIAPEAEGQFLECCRENNAQPQRLGVTTEEQVFSVEGVMTVPIARAQAQWEHGLREKLQ